MAQALLAVEGAASVAVADFSGRTGVAAGAAVLVAGVGVGAASVAVAETVLAAQGALARAVADFGVTAGLAAGAAMFAVTAEVDALTFAARLARRARRSRRWRGLPAREESESTEHKPGRQQQ